MIKLKSMKQRTRTKNVNKIEIKTIKNNVIDKTPKSYKQHNIRITST